MFRATGDRRVPEPLTAECEAIRIHNWMERARSIGEKTSIKTDLREVTAQMEKVSGIRQVERAIQRVRFALDICLMKISLGVKCIAAKLTCETYAEIQVGNTTYDSWYHRLRTTTVADVAKILNLTKHQLDLCFGLGWSPDVIRVEFGLQESAIIELSRTIGEMSLIEVLALKLTFGHQRMQPSALPLPLGDGQKRHEGTPCIRRNFEEKGCPSASRTIGGNETILVALDILLLGVFLRPLRWHRLLLTAE